MYVHTYTHTSALPRRTEFNLRSVLVGFLVEKVALEWVFLTEYFRFPSLYYSSSCPYAHFFHLTSTLYNPSNQQRRYVKHFSHPCFPSQLCVIIFHRDAIGSGTQPAPRSMVNEGSFPGIKMADTWHQHTSRFVTQVKNNCSSACIVPYGCTVWYLIKLRKIDLHRCTGPKKSLKLSQIFSPSKFSAVSHFSAS
jgi:hypothetical protein